MRFKSHSSYLVSHAAILAAALTQAGCSGGKDLVDALNNDSPPVNNGAQAGNNTGGGDTNTGGTGNTGTGATDGNPPAKVAIGASGNKTAQSVDGGGLFVRIPDLGKVTIADRSRQGGNGVTWTPDADGSQITLVADGTLASGTAVPSSTTIDKDPDFSGSANAYYETHTPELGGNGFEIDYSKKYSVNGATLYSSYADGAGNPVFLQYATYGGYVQDTDVQYAKVDVEGQGTWLNKTVGGSSILAVIFGGTPTAEADMPTGVTANYEGTFLGLGVPTSGKSGIDDENSSELIGNVALKANFGSGAVTGNVYNVMGERADCLGSCVEAVPLGLKLTGQIDPTTGNTYQGSVAFTGAATTAASAASQATIGTVTNSDLVGQFYGPKAAETAGALRVEGTVPTLMGRDGEPFGPGMVIGSFGAKKAP